MERDVLTRVVMLGPLPPAVGGMATVMEMLLRSDLSKRCRLSAINNIKSTPVGRRFEVGMRAQMRLAGNVIRTIVRTRADVVHIHTCSGFTFWRDCIHMLIARMMGRRGIWHIHGGYFDRFVASLGIVQRLALRKALEWSSTVIVLSQSWMDALRPYAPRARWHVVPNGVLLPDLSPRGQTHRPVFLFVGNLGREKGAADLIAAVGKAVAGGLCAEVRVVGGETAPGQMAELMKMIADLGCQAHIALTGLLRGEEKELALAGADCFVLPSHGEGLPMALLEAMGYGLPVIVTRVGGIPAVVRDGVEGLLIEPHDVDALAGHLLRLASDGELRCRLGQAARQRVQKDYSLEVMVERLADVYTQCLTG